MSAFTAFGRILGCASDDEANSPDPVDVRDVAAALERARVVGVLDAHPTERGWEVYPHGKGWRCGLGIAKQFDGATPDAARAAAAKAIEAGEV